MGTRTDSELVLAAVAGEGAAFVELYDRHAGRARALARSILGGDVEAEDVAQDAVLAAFVDLRRLRDPGRFGSWLYAIAVNLARMRVRSRRPLARAAVPPEPPRDPDEQAIAVREALGSLPAADRDVVVLHYFHGLSCAEIGERDGVSAGAVRVRLHRARGRLRDELADLRPKEAPSMIRMLIDDVLVRSDGDATGGRRMLRVVLLREREGKRVVPIWVGRPEGDALAVGLAGTEVPRPLTIDLTARLLDAAGARVERVAVSKLEQKTFYAVISVHGPGGTTEIDARPSDALNLAVRIGAPVFVAEEVLAEAALTGDDVARALAEEERKFAPELTQEGEWRSLSGEEVKAAWLAQMPR